MEYHFNVLTHFIFGTSGIMLGYYFANEMWRSKRMWEWKSIQQQIRLQEAEINRLESINDTLVVQLKELRMNN